MYVYLFCFDGMCTLVAGTPEANASLRRVRTEPALNHKEYLERKQRERMRQHQKQGTSAGRLWHYFTVYDSLQGLNSVLNNYCSFVFTGSVVVLFTYSFCILQRATQVGRRDHRRVRAPPIRHQDRAPPTRRPRRDPRTHRPVGARSGRSTHHPATDRLAVRSTRHVVVVGTSRTGRRHRLVECHRGRTYLPIVAGSLIRCSSGRRRHRLAPPL